MNFSADALTVFAVLVQGWQLDLTQPVVLRAGGICLSAWILIGMDFRRDAEDYDRATPQSPDQF